MNTTKIKLKDDLNNGLLIQTKTSEGKISYSSIREQLRGKTFMSIVKSLIHRKYVPKIIIHLILVMMSFVYAVPLVWLISSSLKTTRQMFKFPPEWIPNPIAWLNYPDIFYYAPFHRYFFNTISIVVISLLGTIISCSLVAYGFARYKHVKGNNVLFMLMLSTMMLPFMVTLIPQYVLFTKLHWINTILPLTIPSFFAAPVYVFLLRQFMLTIPAELGDSGTIDGCSSFQIFFRIIVPLIKPALATVSIFTFMAHWNDFLGPLLYLQSPDKFTIAIGLQVFQKVHNTKWGLLMAASTLAVMPVIVIFFFAQKQFIQGITMTGLKG